MQHEEYEEYVQYVKRPWASFSSWMAASSINMVTWSIVVLAFVTGAIKPLEFGDTSMFFSVLGVIFFICIALVLLTKSELFTVRPRERVVRVPRSTAYEDAMYAADEQPANRGEEVPPVAASEWDAPEPDDVSDDGHVTGHDGGSSTAPRNADESSAHTEDESDVTTNDEPRTT